MNRLQHFWLDIIHPSEWGWIVRIRSVIWKIKDYDRLEHDYCCVLCHATDSRMSKSNYFLADIYSEIDSAQSESYYDVVKSDIGDILNEKGLTDFGKIEEIKKYLTEL